MSLSVTNAGSGSSVDVMRLMEEASQAAGDSRKDNKIARRLHHDKNMSLLDKSIGQMKDQQAELGKASKWGFVFGMISNFLNIATQALSAIFPPLAPVFMAVNKAVQSVFGTIGKKVVDDHNLGAGKAGVKSEEFKKMAENENYKFGMEDEHLKASTESHAIFKNRMEKALDNIQKSQEAAIRV